MRKIPQNVSLYWLKNYSDESEKDVFVKIQRSIILKRKIGDTVDIYLCAKFVSNSLDGFWEKAFYGRIDGERADDDDGRRRDDNSCWHSDTELKWVQKNFWMACQHWRRTIPNSVQRIDLWGVGVLIAMRKCTAE